MFFSSPWMLTGLLALPILGAIYWLRSRSRVRVVSSLFLWSDQRKPRQGGRILERLQTPLTLLLELLILTALVIASAEPTLTRSRYTRSIVVVLDNSYSMLAGGEDNARRRGLENLTDEFRRTDYVARFILAAETPRLLGEPIRTADALRKGLDQWTCNSPSAVMDRSIALASEVGGPSARILVISDQAPKGELAGGKVQWRAFGRDVGNIAITAASRDASAAGEQGPQDRVLLELTNFGRGPAQTSLTLHGGNLSAPEVKAVELGADESRRFFLTLPRGTPPLRAQLSDDALAIDNAAVLVSPRFRPLRVQLSVTDVGASGSGLRSPIARALEATSLTTLIDNRPDLIITDGAFTATDAWQLQFLRGGDPISFSGPYVLDRSHPLTAGLSLEAVIWTAAGKSAPKGMPIVSAGNTVLVGDNEDASGRHKLQIALEPQLSNLIDSPDWPIMMTNLVRWRLARLPGIATANVRLGQPVSIALSDEDAAQRNATLAPPSGAEKVISLHGKQLEVQPEQTGLYSLRIGPTKYEFACNALNADESNLSSCASGQWGDWNQSQVFQDQRLSLDWIFILLALLCLALHLELLHRTRDSAP